MREDVTWTNLTPAEIATALDDRGTPIRGDTVRQLLVDGGFSLRRPEKTKALGVCEFRDEQFEKIAALKAEYLDAGNPALSIDTKKKEPIGEFQPDGRAWSDGPNRVLDHDFKRPGQLQLVPHGIYDLATNLGHITLGVSHDTSEFVRDCVFGWWQTTGQATYPHATSILLFCDAGGSNNCRHRIFKQDLQCLANQIGLPIRVAHYLPYCSKYNPIEHRLFPHVSRTLSGIVLRGIDLAKKCIERTHTSTGLKVSVNIMDKAYLRVSRFLIAIGFYFLGFYEIYASFRESSQVA